MRVQHPFEKLSERSLLRALFTGTAISGALGLLVLWAIESGPGIGPLASLVIAGSSERAATILASWTTSDRVIVGFVAGFDFLFGFAWTNTMGLGCVWAGRQFHGIWPAALGPFLAWCCWIAMILDVPENVSYLVMVAGPVARPWPLISALAVYPRILISSAGIVFIASALMRVAFDTSPRPRAPAS